MILVKHESKVLVEMLKRLEKRKKTNNVVKQIIKIRFELDDRGYRYEIK